MSVYLLVCVCVCVWVDVYAFNKNKCKEKKYTEWTTVVNGSIGKNNNDNNYN